MALTDQRATKVKAVHLMSGSLYQATQVTDEISLEAQVNQVTNEISKMCRQMKKRRQLKLQMKYRWKRR